MKINMTNKEMLALVLTVFAGLATAVGSMISFFTKRTNTKLLASSLGFSAGVMIYVSMVELYAKAFEFTAGEFGSKVGSIAATVSFFGGMFLIGIIDYVVPSTEGDIGTLKTDSNGPLKKMGILMAASMAVHNFPEGLVTFTSSLKDIKMGVMIAVAIAIHNIPEGMATSMPVYFSTGNRKKAFMISFLSGITEPLGAIAGYMFLRPYLSDGVMGIIFGAVAGIMMFISIEELLPMAREYEKSKLTILSVVGGMLVMALSLILM